MEELTQDEWTTLIDEMVGADALESETNARTNYVGRGYRAPGCIAFTFDEHSALISIGAALAMAEQTGAISQDPRELALAARVDSMGKGFIVYFPGFTVEPEEGEYGQDTDEDDDSTAV